MVDQAEPTAANIRARGQEIIERLRERISARAHGITFAQLSQRVLSISDRGVAISGRGHGIAPRAMRIQQRAVAISGRGHAISARANAISQRGHKLDR